MPGVLMDGIHKEGIVNEVNQNGDLTPVEETSVAENSQNGGLHPQGTQNRGIGGAADGVVETSIEQLYENVFEMQSSDQSPSKQSFGSEGEESRIDSELRHLVGGRMKEVEIIEEDDEEAQKPENDDSHFDHGVENEISAGNVKSLPSESTKTSSFQSKKATQSQLDSDASAISSPKCQGVQGRPPKDKRNEKNIKKAFTGSFSSKKHINSPLRASKLQNGYEDSYESGLDNPDLGPFLLKQARDLISSGDNPQKALELALRAAKSFEKCANGKPNLDVVMALHVTAAIH